MSRISELIKTLDAAKDNLSLIDELDSDIENAPTKDDLQVTVALRKEAERLFRININTLNKQLKDSTTSGLHEAHVVHLTPNALN